MPNKTYLLKIELKDIEPIIWRRFIVPSNITLDRLHDIIQIVMGFTDYHLHEFVIDGKRYTEEPEFEFEEERSELFEESIFLLNKLVKTKNSQFEYNYDFGDDWRHTLTLENANYKMQERDIPVKCLEGERACPPEDVGGVGGYEDFCSAMADKSHEEHKRYRMWFGSLYKPEFLDINIINAKLMEYMRWSRNRYIPYEYIYY